MPLSGSHSHTATVTVDQTTPAASLDDFTMYIDLADMPAAFWDSVANGGGDIRTFLADGTELAREVVSCEPGIPAGIGPSVVGVATSTGADSGSPEYSFDINLPSGIASGDVLLLIGINGSGTDTFSAISGFDVLEYESNSFTQLFIAARVADGTEGASVSASWTASVGNVAFLAYCIRGTSLDNLEFLLSSRRGTSTPLFPTFTHSKDDNNLFIAAGFFDDDNSSVVSASSGWDNFQIASSGTVTNSSVRVAAVQLEQEGDSVSPGGWQLSELEGFWPLIIGFAPKRDQGELHVKVPTLSIIQDTVLHIYTDGASADYAATDTFGRNAVWGDYAAVYHLGEAANTTAGGYIDSAGSFDATGVSMSSSVDGPLGAAAYFDGSSDYLSVPADVMNASEGASGALTVQGWAKLDSLASDATLLGNWSASGTHNVLFYMDADGSAAGWRLGVISNSFASAFTSADVSGASTDWDMVHGVRGATSVAVYTNGSLTDSASLSGGIVPRTSSYGVGSDSGSSADRQLEGAVDEVRLRADALSANWITTEYNNQSDPTSFYTATDPSAGGGESISPDSLYQSVSIEGVTLTQAHVLAAANLAQLQAIGAATLAQANSIAPHGVDQTAGIESATLTQAHIIAPAGISQHQQIGTASLVSAGVLSVFGLAQTQTLDEAILTVAGALDVDGVSQSQVLEALTLVQNNILAPAGLAQEAALEATTINAAALGITPAGIEQVMAIDPTGMTQYHVLAVSDLAQDQILEAARFGGLVIGELQGRIYVFAALDGDVYAIPALTGTIH
jgi:hypothetical protein